MTNVKLFDIFIFIWSVIYLPCFCDKPNVIMIVADDMGFNDASFHGCQQIPTPNLDGLANSGIILNRYYALSCCTPTRATIMTGRYPIHTGMQTGTIYAASTWALGLDEKLLPQYLKELGYRTHAIGKWHLGFFQKEYTPTQRGFDTFYGYYGGQANYWDHSLWSNNFWGLDLHKDTPESSESVITQWGNYSSNMYTLEAIDRINNHNKEDPLFVYLSYQAVHAANLPEYPLQAPQRWVNKFSHIQNRGRRHYAAMVAAMDDCVGQLYKALEKNNMLDNTIIIFTSDNGGPANGLDYNWATNYPLRGAKTTVYEGGVRVAGFIHSKLFKNPPRVSHDLMHVSDWLPTIIAAAGGDLSKIASLDGVNQWEMLTEGIKSPRKEVLVNIETGSNPKEALISGDWKLVNQTHWFDGWYAPPGYPLPPYGNSSAEIKCGPPPKSVVPCGGKGYKPCLFNIIKDPCEHNDVSDQFPDVYESMLEKLNEYRKGMVKARQNTSTDPEANPKKHNGAWIPWRSLESVEESGFSFIDVVSPFVSLWSLFH